MNGKWQTDRWGEKERMSARATARETHRKRQRERGGERERTRQSERKNSSARGSPRGEQGPRARAWAHARTHLGRGGGQIADCRAVCGVRDSEAAPAGLGQHARRERPPLRAGDSALPVHVALVPRALIVEPVGPGGRAVPMPLVIAPAAPAGSGERDVPTHLVLVMRARVAVPVGPGVRAMTMHLAAAPRASVGADDFE